LRIDECKELLRKGGGQTAERRGASPADAYEHVRNPVYKHRNV
jgi:hypothetical protein